MPLQKLHVNLCVMSLSLLLLLLLGFVGIIVFKPAAGLTVSKLPYEVDRIDFSNLVPEVIMTEVIYWWPLTYEASTAAASHRCSHRKSFFLTFVSLERQIQNISSLLLIQFYFISLDRRSAKVGWTVKKCNKKKTCDFSAAGSSLVLKELQWTLQTFALKLRPHENSRNRIRSCAADERYQVTQGHSHPWETCFLFRTRVMNTLMMNFINTHRLQ